MAPQKKLKVDVSTNPAEVAGSLISKWLIELGDRPVLFLIAGGSAQEVLDYVDPESLVVAGPNITVTATDERYTDDVGDSNFGSLQITPFYDDLIATGAYCIDTQVLSGETFEENAQRFETNLKEWKRDFPKGIVIGLFGVGSDGHTAGIIPEAISLKKFDELFNSEKIVATLDLTKNSAKNSEKSKNESNPHLLRVTTTFTFMREWIDRAVVYMAGANKLPALELMQADKGSLNQTPARIFREMKDVVICTDIQ